MRIAIINGPNLNLTGKRDPQVYGTQSLNDYFHVLATGYPYIDFTFYQSNVEGEIVNEIQRVGFDVDGIVINAGAYSHYSIAIADALRSVTAPAIEVHISNIFAREKERHQSVIAPACKGMIAGLGLDGYRLAVEAIDSMVY